MENLFSEDPQFRRVQYKKLSDNVREWQQQIAAIVTEKLPRDLSVDVTVIFQQVNDEKGYAIGTAIARDTSSERQIGVPVIVKSWHLAPIDLFFSGGQLLPLNETNLARVFFQTSMGAGLAPQQPPPNMVDDVYAELRNPPLGGKYSYSAPFSFLRLISGTLGADDLQHFKQAATHPNILAAYQRRGNFDVLCKIAEEKPLPTEQDDINADRAKGVLTVKKDGPDRYRLYSSTDEVYDPVLVSTNRRGAQNLLNTICAELVDYEKDPMLVADMNGHVTIKPPTSPYGKPLEDGGKGEFGERLNPFVFDPLQDDRTAKVIDSYGRYAVRDRDGVLAKGWVVPNVVNFDGSTVGAKLFLGKALASYQSRIVGIPLPDDADTHLEADRPDTGKTGVLMYREGKDVFATLPFQITGVTIYKNLRALSVVDMRGNQANLIITPNIDGIVKVSGGRELGPLIGPKANYFVSAKMFFVRTPRLCAVSESPDEFKRIAADWLDANPVKVAMANGRYVFRSGQLKKLGGGKSSRHIEMPDDYVGSTPLRAGGLHKGNRSVDLDIGKVKVQSPKSVGLEIGKVKVQPTNLSAAAEQSTIKKASFDFNSLDRHEAEFLLTSWGLPLDKTAQLLDGVRHRGSLEVHHLRIPPAESVKLAARNSRRSELAKFATAVKAPIAEIVKIAANLEDTQSVDSVLSLGFVNPENISRFASAKPMLWEVCHMLAKMLLAARLGMEDIPEEAVRAALDHLQRILDGLDRLKLLEANQAKTASVKAAPNHIGGRLGRGNEPLGIAR